MKTNRFFPVILSAACLAQALEFTRMPSIVQDAGATWKIEFAVDESTDVEVSIVNSAANAVVRHLAAGVLGGSAPAPLVRSSLSQVLTWDGNDDYGQPAASPENLTVRVRAGMGVRLDNYAGGDPYEFGAIDPAPSFGGMVQGVDGSFFILSRYGRNTSWMIRQYSPDGNYLRTVFPIPGSRTFSDYAGWGLNSLSASDYSPKTQEWIGPLTTLSPIGAWSSLGGFMAGPAPGQLGMVEVGANRIWAFNEDGTCNSAMSASNRSFLASPAFPSMTYFSRGPRYFAVAPDFSYFLLGGFAGPDTGFYRDGRLFKVDMATRNAAVLFDLDSVVPAASRSAALGNDYRTEICGVAIGDSGRVFVCDRLYNRLLVLSPAGAIQKSFSVQYPDNVAWCGSNGALYVTRMSRADGFYLDKIANWRTDTAATSSMLIKKSDGTYGVFGYCDAGSANQTFITPVPSAQGTLVWVAARIGGVVLYRDSAGAFPVYKDFRRTSLQGFSDLKRMAVDPVTETAYITGAGGSVYKVGNWTGKPAFVPCSTNTGRRLTAYDLALDPRHRHIFLRTPYPGSVFMGYVERYSLGSRLTPAPLATMDTTVVVDSFCQDGSWVGPADLGIAAAPNGHLAALSQKVYCASSGGHTLRYYPVNDTQSRYRPLVLADNIEDHPNNGGAAVRFDLRGNLYMGFRPATPSPTLPSVIATDPAYNMTLGSIRRYAATGPLSGDLFTSAPGAPEKVYSVDFGAIGVSTFTCFCMTAMFSVDAWGRLYVPNGAFQKITVMDNEGNRALRFGTYGNADDLSAEAAGPPPANGTAGRCTMAYPFAVDASDDYIYAADPGNITLARFKKTFILDNVPSMSTAPARPAMVKGPLALSAFPNPFTPQSRISVVLPSAARMTLEVIDMTGRLVKQVASGPFAAGQHAFAWKGDGASGIYILRLRADGKMLARRIIIAR